MPTVNSAMAMVTVTSPCSEKSSKVTAIKKPTYGTYEVQEGGVGIENPSKSSEVDMVESLTTIRGNIRKNNIAIKINNLLKREQIVFIK